MAGSKGRRARTAHVARELAGRFRAKRGSILCRDLIHFDLAGIDPLTNPDAMNQARENDVFAPCLEIVKDSAAILEELLDRLPKA
jgi:hypothetical protein